VLHSTIDLSHEFAAPVFQNFLEVSDLRVVHVFFVRLRFVWNKCGILLNIFGADASILRGLVCHVIFLSL